MARWSHPRTGLVSTRTMEFCRRWGIAAEVRACGFPEDFPLNIVFCTSLNGHTLERADYPSMRELPTPPQSPEKKQRCPQSWFDPILRQDRGPAALGAAASARPPRQFRRRTRRE